jgi:3-keto-disaccharide hydrolase
MRISDWRPIAKSTHASSAIPQKLASQAVGIYHNPPATLASFQHLLQEDSTMKLASLTRLAGSFLAIAAMTVAVHAADNTPPEGFTALFNGKDLSGWKGLMASPLDNPAKRAEAKAEELAEAQKKADEDMKAHWKAVDGVIVFDGKGRSLATAKDYGDFELYVDWKIEPKGDSGIYLRGTPQVQIWDPALQNIGSGGLYNNQKNPSKPMTTADKPVGEWNTFKIKMVGDKVTVHLNDVLVVDNVVLENYWERDKPIYPTGQIELQNHGNTLYFKNIYIKELPR